MGSKITSIMQTHSSGFTKSEIKICHYINSHRESVMYLSITELAELIGVGEATILRFCRKIGYKGYQDFKLVIKNLL
ncbi:MAG: MurR/RpiR family transcriptional regulator [Turicibacter sanguinis]